MLSTTPKISAVTVVSALGIGAALLSGCASTLERSAPPDERLFVGNQASSSELVFASPSVTRQMLASGDDETTTWEFARSDSRMNASADGPLLATAQWPEPERAWLTFTRSVWISPNPNTVTFSQTPSEAGAGGWWWSRSWEAGGRGGAWNNGWGR